MVPRALKIGLSARLMHNPPRELGFRNKTLQYLEQSIAHWIMAHGAIVLMIPTISSSAEVSRRGISVRSYVNELDALVLQGGADVSPQCYGEEPLHPDWAGDRVRDAYEMELLHEFMEAGKAVLGICRGEQLINVALGGTLFQDIATQVETAGPHVHADYDRHSHAIEWAADSGFARLFPGMTGGDVVSIHHQSINALGRGLRVEARSAADGIIEAIRLEGRPYVLGVQWHPEFHPPGSTTLLDCTPILDEFLNAARGKRW